MNIINKISMSISVPFSGHIKKGRKNQSQNQNILNPININSCDSTQRAFVQMQNRNAYLENRSQASKETMQFGMQLLDLYNKDKRINFKQELQKKLLDSDANNIDVLDISEAKKEKSTAGGFQPTDALENNGGVIYVPTNIKNKNDKKEILRQVQLISHELCHAKQNQFNPFGSSYSDLSEDDKNRLKVVVGFITEIKKYITNSLQMPALQYAINNYETYKIDMSDLLKANNEINCYGTIFPGAMKKLSNQDIYNAYKGKDAFNKTISSTLNEVIKTFNNSDCIDQSYKDSPKTYSDLLKYSIYELRNEAEAYQINSDLNKYYQNINPRKNTLNDLIPMTYAMVADELSKISEVVDSACEVDNVEAKDIETLIYNLGCFPDGKEFATWAISELKKSEDERSINPNITLKDIASMIWGMKKEDVETSRNRIYIQN